MHIFQFDAHNLVSYSFVAATNGRDFLRKNVLQK